MFYLIMCQINWALGTAVNNTQLRDLLKTVEYYQSYSLKQPEKLNILQWVTKLSGIVMSIIQGHFTESVTSKTDFKLLDKLPEAARDSVIKIISYCFWYFRLNLPTLT